MTAFTKTNLEFDGMYLMYVAEGSDARNFVARFKRGQSASFITFLIKNFTVEEYFERLNNRESPLPILQSKGYLQPHIKQWLKKGGYPVTTEGFSQFVADQLALRKSEQPGA